MRYEINILTGETLEFEDAPTTIVPEAIKSNIQLLAETDAWMDRISEDSVVALIIKGTLLKADFAPIVIERINYRRSLRGQDAI